MEVKNEWKNKSGIYKIECFDKYYIGSTVNLYERLAQHISHLRKNKHHSQYMQRCFNKYGELNFNIKIIEYCEKDIAILRKKELIQINQNNCVFNSTTPITYEHSSRMKKQISDTLKRKYRSGEIPHPKYGKGKRLWLYDFSGKLLAENVSSVEAYKILNLSNRQVITGALNKNRPIVNKQYIVLENNNFDILYDYIKLKKGLDIKLYKIYNNKIEECSMMSRRRILEKVVGNKDLIYYSKKNKCYYTFIGLITKCRLSKEISEIITAE